MTNIPGNKVILDSDALIALLNKKDKFHKTSIGVLKKIKSTDCLLAVSYYTVLEASTTLSRKLNKPYVAKKLLKNYKKYGEVYLSYDSLEGCVGYLFDPAKSKKHTPFDYHVLCLAKANNINSIFSFDSFYKKNGLELISNSLLQE
ncbi:hypothetical protein COV24_01625 [candidate division WWE3 bacterium CG10_big_fil_rev_8_21_14_0_10_32_10]|uniref:PIN domain-containing protein n=1 Tax=candidate division WWE3 bacterium CG10_big_fil_rev_8_21_14_0_10_32_10 TaxID=1975090 RepID=A0A2H0RC85_UNCKA|nr:MAG: hypothetical protein COV24_01625 [candidate division WWE3 bacterium CG10_big_fil_rev_8_21_14_0_10_32_10]